MVRWTRPIVLWLLLLPLCACSSPSTTALVSPSSTPISIVTPTTATTFTRPTTTSPTTGLYARFLNLPDSGELRGTLDKNGVPVITFTVELTGTIPAGQTLPIALHLVANGKFAQTVHFDQQKLPIRVEFRWWPRPGSYALSVLALRNTGATEQVIPVTNVRVTKMADSPLTKRMLELYRERFSLNLTNIPIARRDSANPSQSHWSSVAYVDGKMYVLDVFDQGQVNARVYTPKGPRGASICWPAGRYRILVIFVDYDNTGITREAAEASLRKATENNNRIIANYSAAHKAATPILQFETTSAYIARPPAPGELLTVEQVKTLTGYDPGQFDLLAQVDLDEMNSHGLGRLLGSNAGSCSDVPLNQVNLWVVADKAGPDRIDWSLQYTLLTHEFLESAGWDHDWPYLPEQNIADDISSFTGDISYDPPSTLLGWEDLDGDGIIEILDPTPYGLMK